MKKNIVITATLIIIAALVILFLDIKSVDEYNSELLDEITPDSDTVFLTVSCETILNNTDMLDSGLAEYIPKDGLVLKKTEYVLKENDSIYEIFTAALKHKKIQFDISANSYIKGINHIYEFSCGTMSGWLYKVNDEFPSIPISDYKPKNGDNIQILYSCDLGTDVGNSYRG